MVELPSDFDESEVCYESLEQPVNENDDIINVSASAPAISFVFNLITPF